MRACFLVIACAFFFAASAGNSEPLPPRDYSDRIEALRRDVDLLLEANVKLESRIATLEKPPTSPAKPTEQPKQPKLVPSKVAADTPNEPKPATSYTVDTKPGHWTYPGDLSDHLRTTHGVSVDGLSKEQMLNYHDVLHESQPVRIDQPVQAFIQQPSVCPLGQPCPQRIQPVQQTQTYVQPRRTVFRRW